MTSNENIRLTLPSPDYLLEYYSYCQELKQTNINGFFYKDPDQFDSWKNTLFEQFENSRKGIGLPEGYVPDTEFWLLDGNRIIGTGRIRHGLTKNLLKFGGHIGYAIRPSEWNKGYGTIQLKLLLQEARKLGIKRILVTCDKDNVGSARVIEKNGGILENILDQVADGKRHMTCRYWIEQN